MKTHRRFLGLLLAVALLLSMASFASAEEQTVTTITLYPMDGNLTSGKLGGWMGDYLADNYGLAVEVWAYSDDKTNAILASGDLPDVMYVNDNIYETMINAGMLLNLEDYLEQMPHVMADEDLPVALNYVREYKSAGTGKLWFMPLQVGAVTGSGDETERYALRLNWEFYDGIGCPEVHTMWDLIPVVKEMLEKYPTGNPAGTNENKNYGTVLNSGSDAAYWGNAQMPYYWSGYVTDNLPYLLETNMVEGTYKSILDEDSKYHEILKWYNALYREGLMDPDSINLDRPTQKSKVDAGNVMLPSGTNPGWRSIYYQLMLDDTRIYYPNVNTYGVKGGIGINAKTAQVDACLKLFDVFASPDDYMVFRQGPEGEKWYIGEDGHVYMTEKNIQSVQDGTEFVFSDGSTYQLWNTAWIVSYGTETSYTDKDGNVLPCVMSAWKQYREITNANPTNLKWSEAIGHATWAEYLDAEGRYYRTSPLQDVSKFCSQPDDMMKLTNDAICDVVVAASWQMVYSESDEAFDALWTQMVSDSKGLGAEEIIQWRLDDLAVAKEKHDALLK